MKSSQIPHRTMYKAMAAAGGTAAAAKVNPTLISRDRCMGRSRVRTSVTAAATARLNASIKVLADVAAAMPRARPAKAKFRGIRRPQTRIATAANQLVAHRMSVRNSIDERKNWGARQPIAVAQIAARFE